MQMTRRRLVVRRITNPCSYTRFSTEAIIAEATVISTPNFCSYVMCVGNTWTCEMVRPMQVVANKGVLMWCIRYRSDSTAGRKKSKRARWCGSPSGLVGPSGCCPRKSNLVGRWFTSFVGGALLRGVNETRKRIRTFTEVNGIMSEDDKAPVMNSFTYTRSEGDCVW